MDDDWEGLEIHPLTSERWEDLETLFGPSGAYGGCWCMWWRITRREFEANGNHVNRQALREIVESGEVPGVLAYVRGRPVGWCSVAPRKHYGSLNRSPVLKRLDQKEVWSIVCFFIDRRQRGRGLAGRILLKVIDYVRGQGGTLLEAYPSETQGAMLPDVSSFMGVPSLYEAAGFEEVAQPSKSKRIMRIQLTENKA